MHLMKKRVLGLILIMTLLVSTACSSLERPTKTLIKNIYDNFTKSESGTETLLGNLAADNYEQYTEAQLQYQKSFDEYTDEWFLTSVRENTIDLHYTIKNPESFGITDHVPTLGTLSLEEFIESSSTVRSVLEEVKAFTKEDLTYQQQLTYDVLINYLETELKYEGLELYTEFLNPTTGTQAQLPILFAEFQFYTEKDITDYLAILAEVDEYYAQIVAFEKEKSAAGLFMSDRAVDDIVIGCATFIDASEDNYLIEVFNDRIDALQILSEEEKNTYKEQNRIAVYEHVVPGYELLIAGLEELKGTGTNDKGLCYFENGKEYYEYLIASNVGSYRSMDDLSDMISTQLIKDLYKMDSITQTNSSIYQDYQNFTYSLSDPREILEDLKIKIVNDYPALPETSYEIKYVHPSLEKSLSPAFYLTPPVDDSSSNVIYINNGRSNGDSLYTTLAHEGYPGHLYQNIYYNYVDTCNLRRYLSFTGYSEGWATYVEYQAFHYIDGMSSALADLLAANDSATLALYAYIDLSINYFGWDIDNTRSFLASYGIDDESTIDNVYHTMIEEPANYLKYYVGYLEFLELRKSMEAQLGDKFILKDFHEQLLTIGPAPFSVIENYLGYWAATVK